MDAEYQRLEAEAREVEREIQRLLDSAEETDASAGLSLESELRRLHLKLAGLRDGMRLLKQARSKLLREQELRYVQTLNLKRKHYSQGLRTKRIRLRGGVTVTLSVRYYHPCADPDKQVMGRRRGIYPMLHLLGIAHGFTSGVRQRMMRCVALLGSFAEAVEMLAEDGIEVCVNTLRKVAAGMGEMLKRLTQLGSMKAAGNTAGKCIVVSTDGGRVRLREKRRGKSKKGRKRFRPAWREPRLFIIYAADENGRMTNDFVPIIDGSLGSCDQLFRLLLSYLKSLNVKEARKVLFVADGAAWIWKRVPSLIKSLELTAEQTQQRIDFWHAVEYLGKIADSAKLKGQKKAHWLTVQKRRLHNSEIGSVVTAIEDLTKTRRTKEQKTWLQYFVTHGITHRRMDYAASRADHLPIGSGAIESAVRRVINLRVKSNATYWLRENAETIIRFRAWIKAGGAEELFLQTTYVTPELAT